MPRERSTIDRELRQRVLVLTEHYPWADIVEALGSQAHTYWRNAQTSQQDAVIVTRWAVVAEACHSAARMIHIIIPRA